MHNPTVLVNVRVNGSIPSNGLGNVPIERLKVSRMMPLDLCLLRAELNDVPKNGHIADNRILKHDNGVSENDVLFVICDIGDY